MMCRWKMAMEVIGRDTARTAQLRAARFYPNVKVWEGGIAHSAVGTYIDATLVFKYSDVSTRRNHYRLSFSGVAGHKK